MEEKNIILVPVDFTERTLNALEFTYSLAKIQNSVIYLLHVIIESNPLWGLFGHKEQNELKEKLKEKLIEYAQLLSKKVNIEIVPIVEQGGLVDTIIKVGNKYNVKFLVMGTSYKPNLKTKLIGSNALRIINEVNFPVITLKNKPEGDTIKNIVLPLDLTKETKQKVSYAINFGKLYDATVHVCTINTSSDIYVIGRLKIQLEQIYNFLKSHNINCTQTFLNSESGVNKMCEKLLEFSHSVNADLIMIMTKQDTNLERLFLGSLAAEIIHNFDIPVMSIAPKPQ